MKNLDVVGTSMADLIPPGYSEEITRQLYGQYSVTPEDVRLAAQNGAVTAQALFEIMRVRLGFAVEAGDFLAEQG